MRVPFALILFAAIAVACSAASTTGLGTRTDAIAYFNSQGFAGAEASPQASAAPQAPLWVGKGPEDALAEVSGAGNNVDWVSISVDAQGNGGDMLDAFLKRFAPGSGGFYSQVLNDTSSGGSQDQSRTIGGRRVRIQTLNTGDSYLIAMTVTATSAPGSGQ
jgi:hypothetical protein